MTRTGRFPRISRIFRTMDRIAQDKRGVAAVEFAFVVPVLLCMYFITMEASQAIETNKKIGRISTMVADMITQQSSITKNEVVATLGIATSLIQPYRRSTPTVEVVAIKLSTASTPVATVAWSLKLDSTNKPVQVFAKGSVVADFPADLKTPGGAFVQVTTNLSYQPMITWSTNASAMGLLSAFSNINMGGTMRLVPRISASGVECTDCP